MKLHNPELISALLDGELRDWQRWRAERHLRGCVICEAEYRRLRHVRALLAANPPQAAMSDSADFFWSKVKREIARHEPEPAAVPHFDLAAWLWERAMPLAAAVALVVVTIVGARLLPSGGAETTTVVAAATTLPDTTATAVHGQEADVTVIWVTGLPWTPDMTEMQTVFASLDT